LSGNLDDGVLGLAEIKRKGGMAIVQEPKTALFPSMPKCAIASVPIDFVVPVEKMPPLLSVTPFAKSAAAEVRLNMEEYSSKLTCPECHGPISEFRAGNLIEYRCRVGHSYSPLTFAQDHRNMLERKLWEGVLALEESADIADGLNLQLGGPYAQEAHDRRKQASMVKSILDNLNVSSDPIDQAS
jgi:two-component system chemotaxis response regulator CheB